ncbi:DUF4352 domain-containing protein [Schinkia azotoformans]|uniref:DUF4352 domain-containing protein n=1 Tax=Schinkia azotoformans LMG 9581 TaxID=1131731 RepID=K6DHE2_SCHAZ|nr:DUF4352 domain-containing protein [Schinkia azotoformans]EKN67498.1 hypothetical protein BAZO_08411 [Schinkia azotoformans LMG 9581]MEC1637342.1 DUF4352 domain-containing protein [Schinkia azotoformans]MEC1943746.1 DUF4352 domain-containing protein [Schinkia azotoformans]
MKKFLKLGCGGLIGVIVLIIVIGALFGDDSKKTTNVEKEAVEATATKSNEGKKEESTTEEAKKASIGEELTIGKAVFKVNSMEETNKITAGNGMFKYTPDSEGAVFLIVNVTVKNNGTEMIQTDSSFFKLKATSGATYSPSSIIVADGKFFTFEGINPGLALTGNVVFEVPASLTGLDLQVQTGFWGTETGIINLN